MGLIIGRGFLLSYRQVAADHETRESAEKNPKPAPANASAGCSDGREESGSLVLPGLVFLGLRGELNGNRRMGDELGAVCRKLDEKVAPPIGTFGKLGTGDGGNL